MKRFFFLGSLVVATAAAADHPETPGTAVSAPPPAAAPAASAAVLDAVQQKYAGVDTMRASFVQTTKNEIFGAEEQAGEVVLGKPYKMSWDFPTAGKRFVTDGETMWVYTAEDKQVLRFDDVSPQANTAQSLLQSLDRLEELFVVTVVDGAEGVHTFDLAPRTEGQVKQVRLVLDSELVIKHVTITDAYDGVTEMAFTGVQFNVEVPDSAFVFSVPAGVEVISSGGM